MRVLHFSIIIAGFIWLSCQSKFIGSKQSDNAMMAQDKKYLGQTRPGLTPEIFAPNLISLPNEHEFCSVFSKNGEEFYYGVDEGNRSVIKFSKIENGKWTPAQNILANFSFSHNDPFLSPDESRLYFISNMPKIKGGSIDDIDIWYIEREDNGWSQKLINAGSKINSPKNEYYISFAHNGRMYFSSNKNASSERSNNFDIYTSDFVNGDFEEAVVLSDAINTGRYEADVYVAPDESYLIFCGIRKDGLGRGDLYISFNENGGWTEAVNMGADINSKNHELCPFVTSDGKYLMYSSNQDIYWVDATIIDSYRK